MNTRFKKLWMIAVVTGISVVGVSNLMAQSYLDAGAKMRGDFGQTRNSQASPTYRIAAPTQQRSFSYEPAPIVNQPSQQSGDHTDSGKASAKNQPANPPAPMVQRETRTYRSFSYEPGTMPSNGMSRGRSNSLPQYMLPRADSRKIGGGS